MQITPPAKLIFLPGFLALMLLHTTAIELIAQQSEADRELLATVRAKAEKGDAQSQFELGKAFSLGNLGLATNLVEAVNWYRKAAEQNYAPAQRDLGLRYLFGEGYDSAEGLKWCTKAAEQNYAEAQRDLGLVYEVACFGVQDYAQAVKWYRKAAEQNDAEAQRSLGHCYKNGRGVTNDDAEAVKWYRKAAEQNDAQAQYSLGVCYAKGQGVAKDEVEAVKWFRKAAEQDYASAQLDLGYCYTRGEGVTKDLVEAVKWSRKAAEQNVALAQCVLGYCYEKGDGVTKDAVEAVKWYRKAAEQDDAVAQYNLGSCYDNGKGVTKDVVEAVKWYRKAAEQNVARAQYNLGVCYDNGNGVSKDAVEAVKWYRKAAEQNVAQAQCVLGYRYEKGNGVTKDVVEAVKWYRKAAEQNVAVAQYKLGYCYHKGDGETKDVVEAVKWYRKAAEQNVAEAQYNLGNCYDKGDGVTKDLVEAVKWYRKASENVLKDDHETITQIGAVLIEAGEIEGGKQMLQESAEAGNPLAQFCLANLFESGELVPRDMKQALRWYITVVETNREGAQFADIRVKIAVIYRDGRAGEKNPREAFKWLLRAAKTAEAGDVGRGEAMFLLSTEYQDGVLTKKNPTESRKWLTSAAKADNDLAKCFLSQPLNWNGIQNEINTNHFTDVVGRPSPTVIRREVRNWILKEANSGSPIAQYCLAIGYLNAAWGYKDRELTLSGDPLSNYKAGTNWLVKAALQNEPRAQFLVGNCFQYGWGIAKDPWSAFKWYESAARLGDAEAMVALATLYRRGSVVPADGRKAFELYVQAAIVMKDQVERIDSVEDKLQLQLPLNKARIALGELARDGDGVPQSFVEAYAWFNLAAAEGWYPAPQERDRLAKLLLPDQLADAQRRSSEYFSTKPRSSSNSRLDVDDLKASGTGFFISNEGYLISNNHVVEGANQVRLVTSAGLISAKVVKVDAANDLALLKAEGRFAALPVAASRGVKMGGTVATVGFPNIGLQGFAPKLAKGEIASLSGAGDDARYFQISVPVQPGNSGGALVDQRGNVMGVVSAKLSAKAALAASGSLPENVNYAVKSSYLLSFLESVPEVSAKLKEPETKERKFEDVVKSAEQAAVLVLVY